MIYEPLAEEQSDRATEEVFGDPFGPEAREERLSSLMLEVFNGEVGRGRPLKYWENLKLRPQHIQMIVMKASGYKNNAIAERFGLTQARTSVILNHPDALSILSRLVSFQAENLLDIKARIQAHAGEALDTVLTAMRTAKEPAAAAMIGFKLLDRAGYGAVQKSEVSHVFEMPAAEATELGRILSESQSIEDVDYEILQEVGDGRNIAQGAGETGNLSEEADRAEVMVDLSPSSFGAEPPRIDQRRIA